MANCEKCGTTFTPNAERTEVTSLRVLCQKCEEERRAEKATRAASPATAKSGVRTAGAAAGASAAAAAANSSPRAPAAKPATARPAAAPARTTPAAAPAAAPAPAPERRASANPPSRRSVPAAASSAKDLHGSPSKKLLHRPARGKGAEGHDENYHPDVRREVAMLKQRESKVMTIAWIICGVLLLTAGAVAFTAKHKHDVEIEAAAKHRSDLDAFAKKAGEFDLKTDDGIKNLLAFTDEEKAELGWEDDPVVGGTVATLVSKAKTSQDMLAEKKSEFERLAGVEGTLQNAASKTPDDLRKARRTLDTLVTRIEQYGDENQFKTRVMAAFKIVDRTYLSRLREEAKTLANGGSDKQRAALTAYTAAEDEATRLLDKAMQAKDEEVKTYFTTQYREITDEANAFVTAVFTPEVVDKTPWTDLLTEDQKKHWQNYGFTGFRLEGGKLEAVGPAVGSSTYALMAYPSQGGFRDFDLEMEFTVKGVVDVGFRVGKRFDNTVELYTLSTTGQEPLKAGQTYTLHATYVGNKLTGTLTPGDGTLGAIESSWTKSRKGALGIQVREGAEMKISRLKVRELRNAA